MMNRLLAASLLAMALQSGVCRASDECCLCNDCDMMMKPSAQVYDIDEGKKIECSEFAELVFANIDSNHEICHRVQETFQSKCCMNQGDFVSDSDHRSLNTDEEVVIPFSRRELWSASSWGSYQSFGSTQKSFSWPAPAPPVQQWGNNNNSQQIIPQQNSNGNALGCTVPSYNNYKTVQVYTPSASGFSTPIGVNCATASRSGVPVSGSMYNVALKCVRCNCCGSCSGISANVCVGNNQPRQINTALTGQPISNTGWTVRTGWRRFLESLGLDE